jgi:hypothetical protein
MPTKIGPYFKCKVYIVGRLHCLPVIYLYTDHTEIRKILGEIFCYSVIHFIWLSIGAHFKYLAYFVAS